MKSFDYTYDQLFNPTLKALHNLNGSASVTEIEEEVNKILNLSEDEANDIHRGSITKLSYRLAWSRNYLKRFGLLENSSRGIWALTSEGLKVKQVDKEKVKRAVKVKDLENQSDDKQKAEEFSSEPELTWQEFVLEILQKMKPANFERLCQRLLRELGFLNVEVTGKSGDGGIDGKGILRMGGVLSFNVVFQCKRYKGSVASSVIRDFRGSMIGRADKGLLITTGSFSREAKKEATRDGAPAIDLIDGIEFAEKLKQVELGIKISHFENISIDKDWFKNF